MQRTFLRHNTKTKGMQFSHYINQLKQCAKTQIPTETKQLHAQIVKTGLNQSIPLTNKLIDVYAKCGLIPYSENLFDEMPQRDLFSWATILCSYNQNDFPSKTLSIFPSMYALDGLLPDHFLYATLLKACRSLCALKQGKQVHARFVKSEFGGNDVIKSSLVDMYSKCGLPNTARAVFDSILVKNAVSWTTMLYGYARSGLKIEALELFSCVPGRNLYSWTALISGFVQSGKGIEGCHLFIEMRRESIDIVDPLVFLSVVGACANLAVLELGKQVHGLVIMLGFESSLSISNALVDMYAKCSDIVAARDIFSRMSRRNVISWTSVIVGAAQHGRAKEALDLYDEMILAGVLPNEVTFVGLIYACSHAGLVDKGRNLFKSMEEYGVRPSLQHYTCFLDLLSRSGHLQEAESLINSMPFEPDEPTWAALLSACKQHGNIEMGIRVADHLLSLKPKDASTYILLSNVYANASMWESKSNVRKLMKSMDVQKQPGYSFIDFGKESVVLHAGEERNHPMKDQIFSLLKELEAEMRKRGYVPDTSHVLHDMEEQEKERQLFWHSERLAVAYGLIKAVPGTVIRIVKNLRVCGDCHNFMKLLSSIVQREVIVRDASRYHHFKDGRCSCNDFW